MCLRNGFALCTHAELAIYLRAVYRNAHSSVRISRSIFDVSFIIEQLRDVVVFSQNLCDVIINAALCFYFSYGLIN